MTASSTPAYRFSDLVALARRDWIEGLTQALAGAGYPGYRRSDSVTLRVLLRGPLAVGRLAELLHVSRQAARKAVTGLEQRGYAATERDTRDGRQTTITLTAQGRAYAEAIVRTIDLRNARLAERVGSERLAAADTVLRALLEDEHSRALAARIPSPRPSGRTLPPRRARESG